MLKKFKKNGAMLSGLAVLYSYSNVAHAELTNMTNNGNDVEVDDNDLLSMIIGAGATFVAAVCGLICIYGLIMMIWDTWKSIKEFRAGKIDTLGGALEPLLTNGFMVVVSFAVGVYITTNFTNWLS
jgi:hypothetical protein